MPVSTVAELAEMETDHDGADPSEIKTLAVGLKTPDKKPVMEKSAAKAIPALNKSTATKMGAILVIPIKEIIVLV